MALSSATSSAPSSRWRLPVRSPKRVSSRYWTFPCFIHFALITHCPQANSLLLFCSPVLVRQHGTDQRISDHGLCGRRVHLHHLQAWPGQVQDEHTGQRHSGPHDEASLWHRWRLQGHPCYPQWQETACKFTTKHDPSVFLVSQWYHFYDQPPVPSVDKVFESKQKKSLQLNLE